MNRRHLWVLVVGAALLASSCSQSYTDIKSIRCPTDLLCPGGLVCLNGYCVNHHGSSSSGGFSGFGSTGFGSTGGGVSSGSTGGGACLSCPELFLQGSVGSCTDDSANRFNKLKSVVCSSSACDTSATCESNLCKSGITLPTSGGIGGIGGGGMSPQCEACAVDVDPVDFNACAFDPINGQGTTGTVTTGGTTGFTGSTGLGTGTGGCLGQGDYCDDIDAVCCSPYTCNSGECSQFSTSTTGSSGSVPCSGAFTEIIGTGGNCLSVSFTETANTIEMEPCTGESTQLWSFQSNGGLYNDQASCLELDGSSASVGSLDCAQCNSSAEQDWHVSGSQILGLGSLCLDVFEGSSSPGTTVDLTNCNNTAAQNWVVVCSEGTTGTTGSTGSTGGNSCTQVTVSSLCPSTDPNCGEITSNCSLDGETWGCYATTTCNTTKDNSCNCATGSAPYTCSSGTPCTSTFPCGGTNPLYDCRTTQDTEPGCTDALQDISGTCYCSDGSSFSISCGETTTCQALCGG